MDFWLAIVIIVVVTSGFETLRQYYKRKDKGAVVAEKHIQELKAVISKQDERISNLETVILDIERDKKFDDLR